MTKKASRSLVILAAVLAILIFGLLAVVLVPKLNSTEKDTSTVIFSVNNPVEYSTNFGEDVYTFRLEDDTWVYQDAETYPIKQAFITRVLKMLTDYSADRVIEQTSELSAYGLDPAVYTLTVTDDAGTSTLKIGNQTADEKGYYAHSSNVDGICIIPSAITYYLGKDIWSLLDVSSIPSIDLTAISAMTIEKGGKEASFTQKNGSWYYLTEEGTSVKEEDMSFTDINGEAHTIRKYLNDAESGLSSFHSASCAGYDASQEELSALELTAPLRVSLTMADGTENIYFIGGHFEGNPDSENRYLKESGSPAIYLTTGADAFETVWVLMAY